MSAVMRVAVLFILTIATLAVVDPVNVASADKNPQSQCITEQNQLFLGKEQRGEAYEFSKDACQQLSK